MRKTNLFKLIAILACMALIFAGCSGEGEKETPNPSEGGTSTEGGEPVEETKTLNDYTLDEIIEKAKAASSSRYY